MSDNVTDEYSVPLTKQPKQSKKKSTSYDTKTDSSDTPPKRDTPNKKPRKPKTEKQMEQKANQRKWKLVNFYLSKAIKVKSFLKVRWIIQVVKRNKLLLSKGKIIKRRRR